VKKKIIIVAIIVFVLLIPAYLLIAPDHQSEITTEAKQLYTCGMHPNIISDKPGDCPICGMKLVPIKNTNQSDPPQGKGRKILYWRAPMDPNEIYDHPGKSKMGMDLVPVYEDEAGNSGVVKIDPAVEQNMNVKMANVQMKNLSGRVVTNGVLALDETNQYIVTTRINGWIEKLYTNYTGQLVSKDSKLMDIYSPELVAAQQELLTALSYQNNVNGSSLQNIRESGNELVKTAIKKLELLEVSDKEINNLMATKVVKTDLTLYAPYSGTVLEKNIIEGQKVTAGTPLLKIANLSNLWLIADIYEYELSKINLGSIANITYNFLPGKTYKGKVSFIYPTVDSKSRTVKLRIDIKNNSGELKPEMFANVEIIGKSLGNYPVVPENAVIRSGTKSIVIIALGNGRFKPQEVTLGGYADGYYQILSGLSEGMNIVTSAQFMIDSESNLRSAIGQMQESVKTDTTMKNMKGEKNENTKKNTKMKNMKNEKEEVKDNSSIVHEGVINVESIDKNKDGKVYQDMMDWNVISDKPGKCPLCGMTLKEVTIDEAKKNLVNHGFEYKK
jgi:Cu(I)/Ag(I) efflux system membrane fusion protein/cobalt-zinc-cadmium efflux system membrane fusion protein